MLALAVGLASAAWMARGITMSATSGGEIGHLADAFNGMVESLQVRFQLHRELSSTLNLQTVLDTLVCHARRLVRGDLAFLACCHERDKPGAVVALVGVSGDAIWTWAIQPGSGWTGEERIQALVLIPVRVRGRCLGVLAVARWRHDPFSPETQEVLERLADEAADAKLQELDRLKSEFVSNVSHELRTPLTAIRMSVDNLMDGVAGEIGEFLRNYLERIRRNTERLARLIADLLDLSRTEAGRIEFRPEAMRLADLVRDVLADRRGVRIVFDCLQDPRPHRRHIRNHTQSPSRHLTRRAVRIS